jgi:exopolysaccharide/PEP-CTERM locus tyrosine autokinase
LGKIAKALAKYATEKKQETLSPLEHLTLTADDIEALMAYDKKTGHLLKSDPETGMVDEGRIDELRNSGTIIRLLQNELIHPGGKLTPKGVEEAHRLEKIAGALPRRNPPLQAADSHKLNGNNVLADGVMREEAEQGLIQTVELFRETPALPGNETGRAGDVSAKPQLPQPAPAVQPLKVVADLKPTQALPKPPPSKMPSRPESVPATKTKPGLQIDESPGRDEGSFLRWDDATIDRNLVALRDPQSFEAEQFKILRTNILFPLAGNPPRSILVTSTAPGEGKTFAAANLAISIALNINRYVLLIDADLRRPQMHARFGFPSVSGLSDYLAEGRPLSTLLLHTKVEKLTLLPAGAPPSNPSELISSERMANLLTEVTARYPDRLVLIDAPPPAMAAETGVLARQVDGILVVVRYGSTRREALADLVNRVGEKKILGSIVNRVETADSRYYGYKYAGYGKPNRK